MIGDGGFQITCQALSTLEREKLGAIVLIIDNGIYGIEQALVDLTVSFQADWPPISAAITCCPTGITSSWPRQWTERGIAAKTVGELGAALEKAKAATRTT